MYKIFRFKVYILYTGLYLCITKKKRLNYGMHYFIKSPKIVSGGKGLNNHAL